MTTTPSPLSVGRAMNTLIEGAYWPTSLATMKTYARRQDDTDGEGSRDHDLNLTIGVDGDVWVQAPRLLRFRTWPGGGNSLRVRNALLVLAEAIRRDNEACPQRTPCVASSTEQVEGVDTERSHAQRTIAELQELARQTPHVTPEWVLTVSNMDPNEMRRRLIRSFDGHMHFAHSLDGISEIQGLPGSGIEGCRSHKEVRSVVLSLLEKIERLERSESSST